MTRLKVINNPQKWLKATTVMYQKKAGYDPQYQDWFWVKYKPDGSLHETPGDIAIAVRVNSWVHYAFFTA